MEVTHCSLNCKGKKMLRTTLQSILKCTYRRSIADQFLQCSCKFDWLFKYLYICVSVLFKHLFVMQSLSLSTLIQHLTMRPKYCIEKNMKINWPTAFHPKRFSFIIGVGRSHKTLRHGLTHLSEKLSSRRHHLERVVVALVGVIASHHRRLTLALLIPRFAVLLGILQLNPRLSRVGQLTCIWKKNRWTNNSSNSWNFLKE